MWKWHAWSARRVQKNPIGKNVAVIKTMAVAVSPALAAVAASLCAFYLSLVNVGSFTLDTLVYLMAMAIIGGTARFQTCFIKFEDAAHRRSRYDRWPSTKPNAVGNTNNKLKQEI